MLGVVSEDFEDDWTCLNVVNERARHCHCKLYNTQHLLSLAAAAVLQLSFTKNMTANTNRKQHGLTKLP